MWHNWSELSAIDDTWHPNKRHWLTSLHLTNLHAPCGCIWSLHRFTAMSLLELQPSTITGKQLLANDFKASHDERLLPLFFAFGFVMPIQKSPFPRGWCRTSIVLTPSRTNLAHFSWNMTMGSFSAGVVSIALCLATRGGKMQNAMVQNMASAKQHAWW